MFESGTTTLKISNEEINDNMEIVKYLEESGLMIKTLVKQLKMKQKIKRRISQHVISTLGASLLGNILTDKGIITAGDGAIRVSQNF